jgi:hypothetical protein
VSSPPVCGTVTSITTGTAVCTGDLTFSGAVSVSGPSQIYVVGDGVSPVHVTFAGATVNDGGDPSQLIVHVVGAGIVDPGSGPQPSGSGRFTGVLDAPRSSLRSADCEFSLTGAAELGSFDCVTPSPATGPSLTLDGRAVVPADTWRQTAYQDVAGP